MNRNSIKRQKLIKRNHFEKQCVNFFWELKSMYFVFFGYFELKQ